MSAAQSADEDLALALQASYDEENRAEKVGDIASDVSIVDEYWEFADPIPNIHELFVQFDEIFFWKKLVGCEVKWSPRMTLCAGMCCYEGYGGLCSIRLSQPLLKLRPRRDLVETLLHEMIHAYLFVTRNNKDHDGHGPEFQSHMRRINEKTGSNISIYHNFHNEVNVYRQHWWKCTGPCRNRPPLYGIIKRAVNRAPSPRDYWWARHEKNCGGSFEKIKEPDGYKDKRKRKRVERGDGEGESEKSIKQKAITGFFSKKKDEVENRSEKHSDVEDHFKSLGKGSVLGGRHNDSDKGKGSCSSPLRDDVQCFVACPVCKERIADDSINSHLDSCLA